MGPWPTTPIGRDRNPRDWALIHAMHWSVAYGWPQGTLSKHAFHRHTPCTWENFQRLAMTPSYGTKELWNWLVFIPSITLIVHYPLPWFGGHQTTTMYHGHTSNTLLGNQFHNHTSMFLAKMIFLFSLVGCNPKCMKPM